MVLEKAIMTVDKTNIIFKRNDVIESTIYNLLFLADPSKELINEYLKQSEVFTATQNGEIIGVIVLFSWTEKIIEIKNIVVKPEFQGQGIGTYLIEKAFQIALDNKKTTIYIGTANSSIGQLYLYQKLGFEMHEIKKDFFIKNYAEPIYENGIQTKHMLMLVKKFDKQV